MADDELAALRAKRMAELQGQLGAVRTLHDYVLVILCLMVCMLSRIKASMIFNSSNNGKKLWKGRAVV